MVQTIAIDRLLGPQSAANWSWFQAQNGPSWYSEKPNQDLPYMDHSVWRVWTLPPDKKLLLSTFSESKPSVLKYIFI